MGFEKLVNEVDAKEAARLGLVTRPLTEAVVQKQLEDLGLEAAFGTHSHVRGLSGALLSPLPLSPVYPVFMVCGYSNAQRFRTQSPSLQKLV